MPQLFNHIYDLWPKTSEPADMVTRVHESSSKITGICTSSNLWQWNILLFYVYWNMPSVRMGLYTLTFVTALIKQALGKCYSDILTATVRYIVPFIAVRIMLLKWMVKIWERGYIRMRNLFSVYCDVEHLWITQSIQFFWDMLLPMSKSIPTRRGNLMLHIHESILPRPLKMTLRSFETSWSDYSLTQSHGPQE